MTTVLSRFSKMGLLLAFLVLQACTSNTEDQEQLVIITTRLGNIKLILFNDTPKHKASFLELVEAGAYDSTTFYRVMKDFMIQGGDLATKPLFEKESRRLIPAEISADRINIRGALGAARQPVNRNPYRKSTTQFYIVQGKIYSQKELTTDISQLNNMLPRYLYNGDHQVLIDEFKILQDSGRTEELQERVLALREEIEESLGLNFENADISEAQIASYTTTGGALHLDGAYTVFGQVVEGMETIDKIAQLEVDSLDNPVEPIYMSLSIEYLPKDSITVWYGIEYPKIVTKEQN